MSSTFHIRPGAQARIWPLDEHGFPTGGPIEGIFRGFMCLEDFRSPEGEHT